MVNEKNFTLSIIAQMLTVIVLLTSSIDHSDIYVPGWTEHRKRTEKLIEIKKKNEELLKEMEELDEKLLILKEEQLKLDSILLCTQPKLNVDIATNNSK